MDQGNFEIGNYYGTLEKNYVFFFFNKKTATMNRKKQCIYVWAQLVQKYTIEWEHISLQSDSSFTILVWNELGILLQSDC